MFHANFYGGGILNKKQANQIISLGVENNCEYGDKFWLWFSWGNIERNWSIKFSCVNWFQKKFFTKNYNIYVKSGTEKLKLTL